MAFHMGKHHKLVKILFYVINWHIRTLNWSLSQYTNNILLISTHPIMPLLKHRHLHQCISVVYLHAPPGL